MNTLNASKKTENLAFVGNNIKMRLKYCCIDAIVSFDSLLDKFEDILTTFDRGLKSNLDAQLKVESTLAGKQYVFLIFACILNMDVKRTC